ncbi:hypothetical protein TIFTF001_007243 [Ficus carica]|uniref:RING-type E3 ubiquitin transferase n=1 Tax=Ficus carica TaxID=3494 RepID=A0AA87ZPM6_FICCA|nr:hypothetical protein TIFTF001_007243 [Ficus carica]
MDNTNDSITPTNYALNGKIMLCSVTIVFIIVCVVACFHSYARWCSARSHHRHRRPRHPLNPPPATAAAAISPQGMNLSILKTIPVFVYSPAATPPLDCAVCLSEFEDGDCGRTLPKCGHAFHVACIDAWFRSHSNCPLCRAPVHQPDPTADLQPETSNSSEVVITVTSEVPAGASDTRDAGCSGALSVAGFRLEWCPRKAEGLVGLASMEEPGSEENSGLGSPERNRCKTVSLERIWSI